MFKIEIDPQNKKIYVDTPKAKCFKMMEGFRINPVSGTVEYEDGRGTVKADYYDPSSIIECVETHLPRGAYLTRVDAIMASRCAASWMGYLKDYKDFYDGLSGMGYSFVASGS